jgi:serpin B
MKQKLIATIVVCLILIATLAYIISFYPEKENVQKDESSDEPAIITGNITSFDDAVNVFGLNLFRQLYNDIDNNIFCSPYSIFVALAMTYEGARGTTATEMKDVLNIEQDNESFHQYMLSLYEYMNKNSEYNISTANALWVKEEFELLQNYLDIIQTYYGGKATNIDFNYPIEAANIINSWIENQTNDLIKDLIKPDYINPMTVLILTNAIYFKGMWKVQFDPDNTTEREFKTNQKKITNVTTMCLTGTEDLFNYTETDDLQILEMPYSGDEISMIVLLPKNNTNLSELIATVDNDKLSQWIDSMSEKELDIYIPKFKIETENYELNDYLINLGMPTAFTQFANFSGINDVFDLFISKVVHKAFIEVNEEGTEAAAATAVIIELTAINGGGSHRIIFDADHPFLYLIRHKETGTILFMGTLTNP